jgi:hypothetical protein
MYPGRPQVPWRGSQAFRGDFAKLPNNIVRPSIWPGTLLSVSAIPVGALVACYVPARNATTSRRCSGSQNGRITPDFAK